MNCSSCGSDLPDDARFCIECGAMVERAATDATVQLSPRPVALGCRQCGAVNPEGALFCVRCGRRLDEAPDNPLGTGGQLAPARVGRPAAPVAVPSPPRPRSKRHRRRFAERLAPAVMLIGLGALFFFTRPFYWPGVLMLAGIVSLISEAGRGRALRGLSAVVMLFGLAIAFTVPKLFFPAILVAVGLNILITGIRRSSGQP